MCWRTIFWCRCRPSNIFLPHKRCPLVGAAIAQKGYVSKGLSLGEESKFVSPHHRKDLRGFLTKGGI
jgi:hypothetical protein